MKTQDSPKRKPRLEYQRNYMRNRRALLKKEKKVTKVDQICPTCGLSFLSYPSQNRTFCSNECRGKSLQNKTECICPECKITFPAKPYRVKNGEAIYCSRECYNKAHNVLRRCPICGTDFSVIAASKRIYCSNECSGVDKRASIGGTKDTSYRGPNWKKQRRKALDRDNNCCQLCQNEIGLPIAVHHKIPYHNFPSYKQANVLSNLISLCSSCHAQEEILLSQQYLLFGKEKGRPRGERNWNTKITNKDVMEIRKLYADGNTQSVLAKQFGMTRSGIGNIVQRKTWKHI